MTPDPTTAEARAALTSDAVRRAVVEALLTEHMDGDFLVGAGMSVGNTGEDVALNEARPKEVAHWAADCVLAVLAMDESDERILAARLAPASGLAAAVEAVVDRMSKRRVDHRHEDEPGAASPFGVMGRAYYYAGDVVDDIYDLRAALANHTAPVPDQQALATGQGPDTGGVA